MKRTSLFLLSAVAAFGCQRDDAKVGEQLAELKANQEKILDAIKTMPAARPGANRAQRPQRPKPAPNSVYSVNINGAPFRGAKDAKKVGPTIEQLLKDYEGDVKIVYKHFVVHPGSATEPALAACAGGLQGKFKAVEQGIWDKAYAKRDFAQATLEGIAKEAGLDMAKYKADRDGPCKKVIAQDQSDLRAVGTSGTPAFYINGRFLSGARPVDQFKKLVDEELKKANDRIGKGEASVSDYYDKFVMAKGLKKLAPLKK